MFLGSIVLFVYLAVLIIVPILVGVYVFRDASRRGMNAALWTLIAVLVPILVGFIIYLLVRSSYPDLKCPQCGTPVRESPVRCPAEGQLSQLLCSGGAGLEGVSPVHLSPVSGNIQHSDSCTKEGPRAVGSAGSGGHCPLGCAAVRLVLPYLSLLAPEEVG